MADESFTAWKDGVVWCVVRARGGILTEKQVDLGVAFVATGMEIRCIGDDMLEFLPSPTDIGFQELIPATPTCTPERWRDH